MEEFLIKNVFSHDITSFEAYCSWWAFPAWESPTISMRKPGNKHNQIDVRLLTLQKLLHTVKNEVVLKCFKSSFQTNTEPEHLQWPSIGCFGGQFLPGH